MSVRSKLLLAQLPLLVAVLAIGCVALWTVKALGQRAPAILKDNYRSVLAAGRMKESIERLDSAAIFLVAGRRDLAEPQMRAHLPRFEDELQVEESNLTEVTEPAAARRLRQLWGEYQGGIAALFRMKDPEAERQYYFGVLQPAFVRVKDQADEILGLNQDAMVRKTDQAGRLAVRMNSIMLGATFLSLLLGFSLSSTWLAQILRPLSVLTLAVRRLGEGDLEARATVGGEDEIAHLAGEFNTMAGHLRQYRKSSLGELLQAQHSSQAAIDSLPDPVIVFGIDGAILNVNQAAEALLGVAMESGVAEPLYRVEPGVRQMLERVRAHVLSGKGPYQPRGFEEAVRVPAADGDHYILPRATPVYSEGGGVTGATVVLQDVTRLRRFDELKNDLVATVAHEFRTPLTSLRMAIHLCIEEAAGPVTQKQADLLYAAREDCERLQSIVDELLTLARIQAGRIDLNLRPTPSARLVDEAVDAHRDSAQGRQIRLRAAVLPSLPDVMADGERIQIVLSNLLTNALRHTPAGGEIVVRAQPAEGAVRFEVTDSGEGIPKEFQTVIFERFFRVPGSASGGAGLGLAISRDIVAAHQGEMGVVSASGHGATFWFTLPVTPEQVPAQTAPDK